MKRARSRGRRSMPNYSSSISARTLERPHVKRATLFACDACYLERAHRRGTVCIVHAYVVPRLYLPSHDCAPCAQRQGGHQGCICALSSINNPRVLASASAGDAGGESGSFFPIPHRGCVEIRLLFSFVQHSRTN